MNCVFEIILATLAMLGIVYLSVEIRRFFAKRSGTVAEIRLFFGENDDPTSLLKYYIREHGVDKRFTIRIKVPRRLLENSADAELLGFLEKGILEAED